MDIPRCIWRHESFQIAQKKFYVKIVAYHVCVCFVLVNFVQRKINRRQPIQMYLPHVLHDFVERDPCSSHIIHVVWSLCPKAHFAWLLPFHFIRNNIACDLSAFADDKHEGETAAPTPEYTDDQLQDIVDSVLRMMDINNDGFVDYAEYRLSGVEENRRDDFPDGR